MDRFVKNFIAASIIYLAVASVLGVLMLAHPPFLVTMKFPHSHLMLLGWVSMMIYGVGYHILPKFAGRFIKHPGMAEAQFWVSNIGLVLMLAFYVPMHLNPAVFVFKAVVVGAGAAEAVSIFMFLYNMMATIYGKEKA